MPDRTSPLPLPSFETLGDLLKFLRRRARLSQRDLSIAVGYSESQISRLEGNIRAPDLTSLAALFAPALHIENEPETLARLMELGARAHGEAPPEPAAESPATEPRRPETIPAGQDEAQPSPAPRHNLPVQLTKFIGRSEQLAEVKGLLGEARLLTLTGPGGTGKTRLSLQVATEMLDEMPDGAWLVELAPLSEAGLVAQTVAAALGLREEADRPALATLTRFLQAKRALLVLDNCEHLVDACARLAEALLRACPHLKILATSREALGIAGEAVWPVPGLALPPAATTDERVADYAAVQLFVERARAVRPGFAVTPQNAASMAQVCRRLDGLPLAIELAAARAALLPVEQIAALLDDAFGLLTGGSRTVLPRHKTLRATVDWSYQLLSEAERRLLRRLAVFAGGWTLEAAQAVGAGLGADGAALAPGEVLDGLARLAAKSLLISNATHGVEARFQMLETIREYAQAKLDASGEAASARERHLAFFLALVERAEPEMRGREQLAWFDRLEAEHDNLRRALEWAAHGPDLEPGLRLASALHYFWDVRGNWTEGSAWFNRLLAGNPAPQPSAAWALALARAARFADGRDIGVVRSQASLALARELGAAGRVSAAYALRELGWHRHLDFSPEAASLQQESLALFEQVGDDWGRATVLRNIGAVAQMFGDFQGATGAYEQSKALFERLGDLAGVVRTLHALGGLATWQGDYNRACELYEAALAFCRRLRDWEGYADTLIGLSVALHSLGHFERATASIREGLVLLRSIGHLDRLHPILDWQAGVAFDSGDYGQAAALLEECRQVAIEIDDADYVAWLETPLANLVRAKGNPDRAVAMIEAILPVLRAGGHVWWTAYAQQAQGEALRDLGEYGRATALFETSLAWFRERGTWREVTSLLQQLGGVARRQGDRQRAASLLGESLRRCQTKGLRLRPLMAGCLAELAYLSIALAQADANLATAERAARLLGAHETLSRGVRLPIPPVDAADRAEYDRAVATLRGVLGEETLDALWAEGLAMGWEQAAAYALEA